MKMQNNLKVQHRCSDCDLRKESFFCNIFQSYLPVFDSLKVTNSFQKGTRLFTEGQPCNGVHMLCQGRVKLSTCSRSGKVVILRIVEPGELLGLSAVMSDSLYQETAEAVEPCQTNFIRKDDFLRFLGQNAEVSFRAAKQLSNNYHTACHQIRCFGLSNSIADRLAKLLVELSLTGGRRNGNGEVHVVFSYTHEEIAEMIGTSRETVSRLLKDFKDRKLISLKGANLIVHDVERLGASIDFLNFAKSA